MTIFRTRSTRRFRIGFSAAMAFAMATLVLRGGDAPTVAAQLGDRTATEILRAMPSDTPPNQRLEGLTFVGGYEIIGQPVKLTADQSATITAALKSPAAFDSEVIEEKMRPGIAYRFGEGTDAVNVLVCFGCDKIAVIPPGADGITTTHHITQATRDALLSTAKATLPTDEAIQELPKVRSQNPVPPPAASIPSDALHPGQ